MTDSRTFAVGDRVVARRNDRWLGVVNGEAGRVTAIADGRVSVLLDGGRTVELTGAYARAGHLDHGYALTAHLAQGATVDRAFVLGSEELYREWASTALTRHTTEARFYVSATPGFLNRSSAPVRTDGDTTLAVARMLDASRAQRLALDGLMPDPLRGLLADALKQARDDLAAVNAQVAAHERNRDRLRWYERAERREIDRRIEGGRRAREHWRSETERLAREVEARPAPVAPPLSRAIDPLPAMEPRARDIGRDRGMGIER